MVVQRKCGAGLNAKTLAAMDALAAGPYDAIVSVFLGRTRYRL